MSKTIKITEERLRNIILEAIENVMPMDFDDDTERYSCEDDFRQNYNFGDAEDDEDEYYRNYDPTAEDPEAYMLSKYYGGDDIDMSDSDLYGWE